MFYCPNCGEPVNDEADSCPHCGSDAETGWNPDVDYFSLELPGDDDNDVGHRPTPVEPQALRLRTLLGPSAIVLCFVLFVSIGYTYHHLWIIVPALFLMVMTLLYLRTLGKPMKNR